MARMVSRRLVLGIGLIVALVWLPAPSTLAEASRAELRDLFRGIVAVRASVPPTARTAESLGTERQGSGVVIDDDGLIVTIGYLVLEAQAAEVVDHEGKAAPADIVGYDHETGFGLLRARGPLSIRAVPLGTAAGLDPGAPVILASRAGPVPVAPAIVVSRRPFAGYWEYLVEQAIFTRPPLPGYGGAALFSADGRLAGIGSLLVGNADGAGDAEGDGDGEGSRELSPGNMFVPIDGLPPILADLLDSGRRAGPGQPWLGVHAEEADGRVFVTRVAADGPAVKAGIGTGDVIIGVGGRRITGLADFWRRVHAVGGAGVEVVLDLVRHGDVNLAIEQVTVTSVDRHDWLRIARMPEK